MIRTLLQSETHFFIYRHEKLSCAASHSFPSTLKSLKCESKFDTPRLIQFCSPYFATNRACQQGEVNKERK